MKVQVVAIDTFLLPSVNMWLKVGFMYQISLAAKDLNWSTRVGYTPVPVDVAVYDSANVKGFTLGFTHDTHHKLTHHGGLSKIPDNTLTS